MDDEYLKGLDREEAKQRLSPEQLERYNELKEKELKEGIEEKQVENNQKDLEAIDTLIQSSRNKLRSSIEIKGQKIRVTAELGMSTVRKGQKLYNLRDQEIEKLPDEKVNEIYNDILEILDNACVDYTKNVWDEKLPDPEDDLTTSLMVMSQIYTEVKNVLNQKKSR